VAIGLVGAGLLAILQVPGLLLPIVIAAVLAATLVPIVRWLMRRGLSRDVASAVATGGISGVIAILTVLSVVYLVGGVVQVASGIGDGAAAIDDFLQGLGGSLEELVDTIAGSIVDAALVATASAAILALILVVGVILTYFFLSQGRGAWERLTSRMAPWRREALDGAGSNAVGVLGGYMLGTGAVSFFGAATQLGLMWWFGVPLALLELVSMQDAIEFVAYDSVQVLRLLRVDARRARDILQTLRHRSLFTSGLVIQGGTEAHRVADHLKKSGVAFNVCNNTLVNKKIDYKNDLFDVSESYHAFDAPQELEFPPGQRRCLGLCRYCGGVDAHHHFAERDRVPSALAGGLDF